MLTKTDDADSVSHSRKAMQFKVVLLGEGAVGKSSLTLRFVKGEFLETMESTIGGASLP